MEHNKHAFLLTSFLLRTGIAISFFYAAFASFLDPLAWIGFIPPFVKDMLPGDTLLVVYSIFEIAMGLWMISGKKIYASAVAASITLAAIILFNIENLDIVFRDVPILFGAVALAVMHKNREQ